MWNIFRRQQQTAQGNSQEDIQHTNDLKTKFDDKLTRLTKELKLSEQQFLALYSSPA
jgi:archaellum component FlaC